MEKLKTTTHHKKEKERRKTMLKKIDSVEIPVKIISKEYAGKMTDFAVIDTQYVDDPQHKADIDFYVASFEYTQNVKRNTIKTNPYVMLINPDGYNFVDGHSVDGNYCVQGNSRLICKFFPEWRNTTHYYIFLGYFSDATIITFDILEIVNSAKNEVYVFQANYGDSYDTNYGEPITLDGQTIFMTNELEAYEVISQLHHITNNTDGLSWDFPSEYQLIPISLPVDIQDGWTQDQVVKVIKEMHFTNL